MSFKIYFWNSTYWRDCVCAFGSISSAIQKIWLHGIYNQIWQFEWMRLWFILFEILLKLVMRCRINVSFGIKNGKETRISLTIGMEHLINGARHCKLLDYESLVTNMSNGYELNIILVSTFNGKCTLMWEYRFEIHIFQNKKKWFKCQGRFDCIRSFSFDEQRFIFECIITV